MKQIIEVYLVIEKILSEDNPLPATEGEVRAWFERRGIELSYRDLPQSKPIIEVNLP